MLYNVFEERDEFKEILEEKRYPDLAKYLDDYVIHWDTCIKEL